MSYLIITVAAHVTYTLVLKRRATVQLKDMMTQRPTAMPSKTGKRLAIVKTLILYWSRLDLQRCVSFRCAAK